jgi:hypothetical protein
MRPNLERPDIVDGFIKGLLKGSYEERTGAGAISLACLTSYWTSTGAAQALTLSDGEEGQFKIIVHAVDGGSIAITPTNLGGATSTTITMATAGDSIVLQFLKGNWWVIASSSNAAVTGSTITYS